MTKDWRKEFEARDMAIDDLYEKLDDTIQRLNEQGMGITRNEYKRIQTVMFEIMKGGAE